MNILSNIDLLLILHCHLVCHKSNKISEWMESCSGEEHGQSAYNLSSRAQGSTINLVRHEKILPQDLFLWYIHPYLGIKFGCILTLPRTGSTRATEFKFQ